MAHVQSSLPLSVNCEVILSSWYRLDRTSSREKITTVKTQSLNQSIQRRNCIACSIITVSCYGRNPLLLHSTMAIPRLPKHPTTRNNLHVSRLAGITIRAAKFRNSKKKAKPTLSLLTFSHGVCHRLQRTDRCRKIVAEDDRCVTTLDYRCRNAAKFHMSA